MKITDVISLRVPTHSKPPTPVHVPDIHYYVIYALTAIARTVVFIHKMGGLPTAHLSKKRINNKEKK